MKFVREDTIIIEDIFPMYFVPNILRKKFIELGEPKHMLHQGGWGNGYVGLPFWHPYYGMLYEEVPVNVHGGLTFSQLDNTTDLWIIGFDTNHGGDNLHNRSFKFVKEETYRLLEQCLKPKKVQRILKLNRLQTKNP